MPNTLTTVNKFIYLASQSPRRQQLLEQLGVRYELLLPEPSEDAEALEQLRPNEAPLAYVRRVTQLKLASAQQRLIRRHLPDAPVLCADTTVALGRTIMGKPADAADAAAMLAQLAGCTHRVLTAVAVGQGQRQAQALSSSQVRFARLDAQTINRYVRTGEPMGKAGAYAVQGRAAAFITHISGSYTGIMGLPLFETVQLLGEFGLHFSAETGPAATII